MGESSRSSPEKKSKILCIEVLISRPYIRDSTQNLFWTLSVYSLENQPVQQNRSLHNSEIFHFMVYDWQRTIKKLLEEQQVPYSIVQYFSPDSIHADAAKESLGSHDNEEKFLSAINDVSQYPQSSAKAVDSSRELILDQKLL